MQASFLLKQKTEGCKSSQRIDDILKLCSYNSDSQWATPPNKEAQNRGQYVTNNPEE
jgi:hypothetical protein